MAKFKVGDRVRVIVEFPDCQNVMGKEGIIVHDIEEGRRYGVSFKHEDGGRHSWRECKPGYGGWNVQATSLELALPLSPFDQKVRAYIDRELKPC